MEMKNYIIAVLVFSGVIVGLTSYIADLTPHYSKNIDDMSFLSQASAIEQNVVDMKTAFTSHVTGTIIDIPIAMVTGGVEFSKLVMVSSFGFWANFFSGPLAHYLFLPDWVIPIISSVVMISIIFATLYIIKWGR
jgi:hypothetical protein